MRIATRLVLAGALLGAATAVQAADLTIAVEVAPTSMDPHFHNFGPNKSLHAHVYQGLVGRAPDQSLVPALATAWRATGPNEWEFALRGDARFHDGTPFTAEDVAFTFRRAREVRGSPSSYAFFLAPVSEVQVLDPQRIRITTTATFPDLPAYVSQIGIVSARIGADAQTADYNAGRAAIGTGPYRFRGFVPGERVELARSTTWNGEAEPWENVTFRVIAQPAARVAALLAGDVDMIANVPPQQVARLRQDARFKVVTGVSPLLVTFFPDHAEREAPFATTNDGRPMPNPFRDLRVRRAVSIAIDRRGIAERVMDGLASPTMQFMPPGYSGHLADIAVPAADVAEARRLLAEAGFPDGFRLTLHCLNNRIVNDEQICQAVAQMLGRIGIRTTVDAMPQAVFVPRAQRFEFSLFMHGLSTELAEPASLLLPSVATMDRERRTGAINRGRYSNAEFDRLLAQAQTTLDPVARAALMDRAQRILIEEVALVPVHHQVNAWATRATLVQTPRQDEFTLATMVRPAR
ncbi:ABC transporter substrate-binding protein [Falsiroseomonas bella]|nr:ABC transporter substrate-binding protein [Falsiroseomonas bella]